jgi:hypothetical protein
MADQQIVCVEKVASGDHHHLTAVGLGTDPKAATSKMTVANVRSAIDKGDTFHTVSSSGGKKAYVEKFTCCGVNTIRTRADDTKVDNLDDLRICSWKK